MVRCCQGQIWSTISAMSDPAFHQFKLRLPVELFRELEAAATAANRSVSAEIVNRLDRSFAVSGDDEHTAGISMGLNDPEDRAAVLKVLLFGEMSILRRRVAELGGRDAVLNADKSALVAQISGPRLTGTAAEKQSHFSKAVGTYPLTTLLTDDELGKIAERVIQIQEAMSAAGNEGSSTDPKTRTKKTKEK